MPALVYVVLKDFTIGKKPLKVSLKARAEVDVSPYLSAGLVSQNDVQTKIEAGLLAQEVRWDIGTIPANNFVSLQYKVRVLYDASAPSKGKPMPTIVNDDFNFTVASGSSTISALYGRAPQLPDSLTVPVVDNGNSLVYLGLYKTYSGDILLTDPGSAGHGSEQLPGIGEVVNAVQHGGVGVDLSFSNGNSLPAHEVVIHDIIPPGTALRGFFKQFDGQGNEAPPSPGSSSFTMRTATPSLTPTRMRRGITSPKFGHSTSASIRALRWRRGKSVRYLYH